jgi:hypothetical protein
VTLNWAHLLADQAEARLLDIEALVQADCFVALIVAAAPANSERISPTTADLRRLPQME